MVFISETIEYKTEPYSNTQHSFQGLVGFKKCPIGCSKFNTLFFIKTSTFDKIKDMNVFYEKKLWREKISENHFLVLVYGII